MIFSNFTKTDASSLITFKNSIPIEKVANIKFYKDDVSGSFSKKEFRWSFNNEYWSSWETLNQGNIVNIDTHSNPYMFFEIRYVGSGDVTSFSVTYNESNVVAQYPIAQSQDPSATIYIPEYNTYRVVNTETIGGQPGSYYLQRQNHKGVQPISSVKDLQQTLYNITNKLNNMTSTDASDAITNAKNIGNGTGLLFKQKDTSTLEFRTLIAGNPNVIITTDTSTVKISLDASLASDPSINGIYQSVIDLSSLTFLHDVSLDVLSKWENVQDLSIGVLRQWNIAQDSSITGLRTYIDGSLTTRDTSLGNLSNWEVTQDASIVLKANLVYVDGSLSIRDTSLGNLSYWEIAQDNSILDLRINFDTSINFLYTKNSYQDTSITHLDVSVQYLFSNIGSDTSVLGAINIGDGSGTSVFYGITNDGSLQFRRLLGTGAAQVIENGQTIEIGLDASFSGEVNTASNVLGGDASLFIKKISQDLQFRSFKTINPLELIITNDASFVYFDVSINTDITKQYVDGSLATRDTSLGNLSGWEVAQDASIILKANLVYVDGSLSARDTSLGNLSHWEVTQDSSIVNLRTYIDGSLATRDTSLGNLSGWEVAQDASIVLKANLVYVDGSLNVRDTSLGNLSRWNVVQDTSIINLRTYIDGSLSTRDTWLGNLSRWNVIQDLSISDIRIKTDTSINFLYDKNSYQDTSISRLDASVQYLFSNTTSDTSVLGAMNVGDPSGSNIYYGITNDGSLQFRKLIGIGAAEVTENGQTIEIGLDASFSGEVNTASNINGGDASIFLKKNAQDLEFRSLKAINPSEIIITNDASFVFFDVSLAVADVTKSYVDGSLNVRDTSLGNLSRWNVTQDASIVLKTNLVYVDGSLSTRDTSLGNLSRWNITQDASIVLKASLLYTDGSLSIRDTSLGNLSNWEVTQDASIVLKASLVYVDGSLSIRDTSLGNLSRWNVDQDTSIVNLRTYIDGSLSTRDTSLGNLSHWEVAQDASLVLKSSLVYVDGSLSIRDTSLGNLSNWNAVQDSSLVNLSTYIDGSLSTRDTSLGNLSHWEVVQDASIVLRASLTYVDGSLSTRDTSLGNLSRWEVTQDSSISNLRTYIDGSLSTRDTSLGNLSNWEVTQDASIVLKASKIYVDGSLSTRDTSLGNLSRWNVTQDTSIVLKASKIYVDGSLSTRDTSLGNLSRWNVTQDGSLVNLRTYVDGSLNAKVNATDIYSKTYIDGSLSVKANSVDVYSKSFVDGSLAVRDTSLGNLSRWEIAQDASIVLKSNLTYVDGSLATRDASIAYLFNNGGVSLAYVDGSLATRDTSLGNLSHWNVTQDGSLVNLRTYIDGSLATRDISLGNLSHWNVTQDASIVLKASKIYVDGSLATRDASIAYLFNNPGGGVSQAYVDGSLATRDASIAYLFNNPGGVSQAYVDGSLNTKSTILANINIQSGTAYTIEASTSGYILEFTNAADASITIPSGLVPKFQISIVNYGGGVKTIVAGADVSIYSRNAARKLITQYGIASAYHRGGNEWVLAGDLTN